MKFWFNSQGKGCERKPTKFTAKRRKGVRGGATGTAVSEGGVHRLQLILNNSSVFNWTEQ